MNLKSLIIILIKCLPVLVYSQQTKVTNDLRLQTKIQLSKTFFQNLETEVKLNSRFKHDISLVDEYNIDLGINYKLTHYLNLGAGYRRSFINKLSYYRKENRLSGEITLKHKYNRLKYRFRARFQNIDDDFDYSDNYKESIIRYKGTLKYTIRKSRFEPYIAYELYSFTKNHPLLKKQKALLGIEYDLKKLGELEGYYRIDNERNDNLPYTFYTIGVCYAYHF